MDLVQRIYEVTASFPDSERFGLVSQMRRAAVSVSSNIAEGAARQSDADFLRFLHIALGSCSELDTQFELARRLGYVDAGTWEETDEMVNETDRILLGLRNSVRKRADSKKQ